MASFQYSMASSSKKIFEGPPTSSRKKKYPEQFSYLGIYEIMDLDPALSDKT